MPGRHYTRPEIANATTLASVIGAEAAAEQLRAETGRPYDVRLLRKWMGETPLPPIEQSDWQRLADLALAKATSMVASGRMTAVQVATIAGIATRNARREPNTPAPEPGAWEPFEAWSRSLRPDLDPDDVLHALIGAQGDAERDAHTPSDEEFDAWMVAVRGWHRWSRSGRQGDAPEMPPEPEHYVELPDDEAFVRALDLDAFHAAVAERAAARQAVLERRKAVIGAMWADLYPGGATAPYPTPPEDLGALLADVDALLEYMQP